MTWETPRGKKNILKERKSRGGGSEPDGCGKVKKSVVKGKSKDPHTQAGDELEKQGQGQSGNHREKQRVGIYP